MIHLDISGREAVFFVSGMVMIKLLTVLMAREEPQTWEEQEAVRQREHTRNQRRYDAP